MGRVSIDLKFLISLWIILILAIIFTYAHHGHLIVDCGREVYYPVQILEGKVLYKDLFNIYGPFSYMFNAVLFKLFGVNLNVFYVSGYFCSFAIVTLIYKLSRKFLPEFLSFSIGVYTISIGVFNFHLFNFIFPYSYGMLYGLVAFLVSVWFLLNYEKDSSKIYNLYLSCFFAGLSFVSKYDFLVYFFVLIYAIYKIKPLNMRQSLKAVISLISAPLLCFGILFLQGLGVNDLVSSMLIIKKMSETQTLKYFYLHQGVYFHKMTIVFLLLSFLLVVLPLIIFVFGFRVKNKLVAFLFILTAIVEMCYLINHATFVFLPLLLLILVIVRFEDIKNDVPLLVFAFSAVTLSLKVFWGLTTFNYGVYYVSFLIIAIFALISDKLKNKEKSFLAFGCYMLFLSVILAYQNYYIVGIKNYYLKTAKGGIYTNKQYYDSSKELIKYIDENTKKTDKIVILPEGAFINFLTGRPSDDYYISLLPLYIETFGEENIIKHFKENKPEYIVFNNWNTKDYYFNYMCQDYALGFCSFVVQNYTQEKVIDTGFRYLIFKRK